jgi:hypothetical protein
MPLTGTAAAAAPTVKAVSTTVNDSVDGDVGQCLNGNPNGNCNLYSGKQYVWESGKPTTTGAGLAPGTYFFAVLEPGGQADPNDFSAHNLSSPYDLYTNRTFTINNDGTVSYTGNHDSTAEGNGYGVPLGNGDYGKIRLFPYDNTSTPGGVYTLAVCSLANGYPVNPASCKYDAFKVKSATPPPPNTPAAAPTVTKDAAGAYTDTWTWNIAKQVNGKNLVQTSASTATFSYTVSVTHDSGTISGVTVSGTIDVVNPNYDNSSQTVPLHLASVSDQLSDGTGCAVDTSGTQTVTVGGLSVQASGLVLNDFDNYFPYSCTLSRLPSSLNNTATATWDDQTLSNEATLAAGSADFMFSGVSFTGTKVDDSVTVTDTNAITSSNPTGLLGTVSETDPNPTNFTYSKAWPMVPDKCSTYPNTATFTTGTTGTTGSASQSVQVCGPVAGGLTMGFWQNKNGQAIINTKQADLLVWLHGYAPFADAKAPVSTYVTNVIKAATAGGASMNPMLKAQMLASALDVYFSDPALGGNQINAPAPIGGVTVDLTNIWGTHDNTSAAFGGATSMTVNQLLSYAAQQSNAGGSVWYSQVKATQGLAKDTFDAINNGAAFTI